MTLYFRILQEWSTSKQVLSVKQERTMTFADVINADKERKRTYKESKSSFENLNDRTVYVVNGLSTFL